MSFAFFTANPRDSNSFSHQLYFSGYSLIDVIASHVHIISYNTLNTLVVLPRNANAILN
jgi:hypothetical protein